MIVDGKTSIYVTRRMAGLLNEHGPQSTGIKRNLAAKLGYIAAAYDFILREKKRIWTERLTADEWSLLRAATRSRNFYMESGGNPVYDAIGGLWSVVDATDQLAEASEMADEKVRLSLCAKLLNADRADQLALTWMLIRSRRRDKN